MKVLKVILIIVAVLVLAVAVTWFGFLKPEPPAISPEDRARINLIPLPSALELDGGHFVIEPGLGFTFRNVSTPRLNRALDRFYQRLVSQTGITFAQKEGEELILDCQIAIGKYPSLEDDESYDLSVTDGEIKLSANSETGILYGLETLLQLVERSEEQWVIPSLNLEDKPRFPWRGLMIDVARHWIPKEVILRNLDAMAAIKMNVFHWHLTEYQGFRIESRVFPKLHGLGSNGDYYTQEEIKEVIEYAADRGIRVVPEFDLPGHSTSWFVGYPELASAPGPYEIETKFGIAEPVMDPTRDEVYEFLEKFMEEMVSLFPDQYLHIGGDEVNPKHWKENARIQEYMINNNLSDHHELQAHFNIRLQKILEKFGKKMMGWDEIIHPDLPKDGIAVQSWRNQKSLWQAAQKGNKAVLSAGYYLDHKQSAGFHYKVDPMVIPGAVTIDIDSTNWRGWATTLSMGDNSFEGELYLFGAGDGMKGIVNFMDNASGFDLVTVEDGSLFFEHESTFGKIKYDLTLSGDSLEGEASLGLFALQMKGIRKGGSDMPNGEPLPKFEKLEPLTPEQAANILGGEACMWSEMVDARTIESRIWPRAAAVAEKLWSPRELTNDEEDMYRRLMWLDDQLITLGLQHQVSMDSLVLDMVEEPYVGPLRELVSILQEDKLFNRMAIYTPELYTTTPLNRVVDAARPESYIAYRFNREVDSWKETKNAESERRIKEHLTNWVSNYNKLRPAFDTVERLKEVEPQARHLSGLSEFSLSAMSDLGSLQGKETEIDSLLEEAAKAYGGTILPVEEGLRKIILEAKE